MSMLEQLAFSSIRISTPFIFAAMGGLLTFKAGILNIALDGFMIVAAFSAIVAANATGTLACGIAAGVIASMLLSAVLVVFYLRFKAHIFIAGIAVTFLAYGLTALLLESIFGQDGMFSSSAIPTFPNLQIPGLDRVPVLGAIFSGHTLLVYVAYASIPIVYWVLFRTRWGLRIRIVGEADEAASAAGVNVSAIKMQAMLASGFFCGLGGAYLSLGYVSLFSNQMTADRGLIAIAAIIFARGNPFRTSAVALLFGLASALAVRLPEMTGTAPQLLEMLPYVITVAALVIVGIANTIRRSKHGSWRFEAS
jgi:general nucleoside transport system permease protein